MQHDNHLFGTMRYVHRSLILHHLKHLFLESCGAGDEPKEIPQQ